jgi:hypothetical protein
LKSARLLVIVASAFTAVCNTSCVHGTKPDAVSRGSSFAVSLPPLKLADWEYIQSIEVTIEGGRIATINRTWDDWDMELDWDSPGDLALKCQARHFSSGFQSTQEFNRFITVQVGSPSCDTTGSTSFDIMATVRTGSPDGTGRGEREYHLARSELILSPRPSASIWGKRAPFYYSPESRTYIVQWGYNATEIAKQLGVAVGELSLLNPGVDLSHLKVGQVLIVSEQERK